MPRSIYTEKTRKTARVPSSGITCS
ncbi:unnamed protein product, partial [Adineta steineri]